jgi:hypothetical protein
MGNKQERRRFPRVRVDGRLAGKATVLTDFRVLTLSETGATLEMTIPMSLGSTCDLSVDLSHVSVDIRGQVVHVEGPLGGPGGYRIGVHFSRLQSLDRALLASFLDRERRKTP